MNPPGAVNQTTPKINSSYFPKEISFSKEKKFSACLKKFLILSWKKKKNKKNKKTKKQQQQQWLSAKYLSKSASLEVVVQKFLQDSE